MTVESFIVIYLMNLLSFVLGAKIGQKVVRQESITLSPVKAVKNVISEHKEQKAKEAEDDYYETLMHNIDNYTGDSIGQVEIPKRK